MTTRTAPAERQTVLTRLSERMSQAVTGETAGAALLVAATVLALVWANSPFGGSYEQLWHTEFSVSFGSAEVSQDLRHWVNDGLMVFFFFLIGMEVRRELSMGELTHRDRLVVPTAAAVAGLVVPALVYLAINSDGPGAAGWGVAMATDTAFVLGALALLGNRVPAQLRVFLLSLSVVDDIGALSAIALFYSDDIDLGALGIAVLCVFAFIALARLKVWRGPAYFAVGVVMWLAMYSSGVHATIGGVVLGLLVSAYPPRRTEVEQAGALARAFRQSPQASLARAAKLSVERAVSPNERIGTLLSPWSAFFVVPVFALANAGVRLDGDLLGRALSSPITLGVFVALVLGKLFGVGIAASAVVKSRLGALPPGLDLSTIWGGAALCGIGFTVSLFVADLAFPDPALREEATVGVLAASVVATALGVALLRVAGARNAQRHPEHTRLAQPVDPETDHIRGPEDAPLTLVEYAGFECPFCGYATGVVEELRERFGDDLRYVFRHLPLTEIHPRGDLAAEACEAAGAQGAFWAMHDRLFAHQDQLEPGDLVDHAAALGLDLERFTRELGSGVHGARVRDDVSGADASGVHGTPTFFINGVRHTGATETEELAAALRAALPGAPAQEPPRVVETNGATPVTLSPPVALPALDDPGGEETPDGAGAFPRLDATQLAVLRRVGRRRRTTAGQVLQRGGSTDSDFIVVLEGTVSVLEPGEHGAPRISAIHGQGRFIGGLNLLSGQRPVRSIVVRDPGAVLVVPLDRLRTALNRDTGLADTILRSFLLRRAVLIGRATTFRVIGDRRTQESRELHEVLAEGDIPHEWLDPVDDPAARRLREEVAPGSAEPVVLAPDGRVLLRPTLDELRPPPGTAD
ncbi:Na+/H+ antiporter NhaA [Prauserella cavernicola]|uniref:Na(+)/H(+) antiporter NhaA n=1 Tax=Prauserella cavernicola TaxID=2800127 RepID=A0A934QPA8_9PSEU|nr:Na+/H+ antiporter NhaA [Prauserella cavernicola]MBK1783601.1 Na+/H+ antiporter NhaA [Prauserella cavernicola]